MAKAAYEAAKSEDGTETVLKWAEDAGPDDLLEATSASESEYEPAELWVMEEGPADEGPAAPRPAKVPKVEKGEPAAESSPAAVGTAFGVQLVEFVTGYCRARSQRVPPPVAASGAGAR